jgi:hypothetical protein
VNVTVKLIRKGILYNGIKVERNGGKEKHFLLSVQEMGVRTPVSDI